MQLQLVPRLTGGSPRAPAPPLRGACGQGFLGVRGTEHLHSRTLEVGAGSGLRFLTPFPLPPPRNHSPPSGALTARRAIH